MFIEGGTSVAALRQEGHVNLGIWSLPLTWPSCRRAATFRIGVYKHCPPDGGNNVQTQLHRHGRWRAVPRPLCSLPIAPPPTRGRGEARHVATLTPSRYNPDLNQSP